MKLYYEQQDIPKFPWILPEDRGETSNSNFQAVAKEFRVVKLGKEMTVQNMPGDSTVPLRQPSVGERAEPKKRWKVETKGVIDGDHPWSLKGIDKKITSVGNWLEKLKGMKK